MFAGEAALIPQPTEEVGQAVCKTGRGAKLAR